MKRLLQSVSILGLILTLVPSFLVMAGRLAWETHSALMLIGMIMWFKNQIPRNVKGPLFRKKWALYLLLSPPVRASRNVPIAYQSVSALS